MDLEPTADQHMLTEAARTFLSGEMPLSVVRDRRWDGPDRDAWRKAGGLGWLTLGLDEQHGGGGGSTAEEILFALELGRVLAPGPFIASSLAARVAADTGDDAALDDLAQGTSWAGVCFIDERSRLAEDRVHGRVTVFDSEGARYLLIVDQQAGSVALTDLPASVRSSRLRSIDDATPAARGDIDAPPRAFVTGDAGTHLVRRGTLLAAAVLAGSAHAITTMTVEYAKVREQFGRPIGSFQAIAHRCADMAVRAESARALVLHAGLAVDEAPADAPALIAAAKAFAGEAAVTNATQAIQAHGAIGFTGEHDAHLYLKRARLLDVLWGGRRSQLTQLTGSAQAQTIDQERGTDGNKSKR